MGIRDLFKRKKRDAQANPPEGPDAMFAFVFPRGQKLWEEESRELHASLRGRIDLKETMFIVARTKALLATSTDMSEDYMVAGLRALTQDRLTEDDARRVYRYLTGLSGPMYTGGDGTSQDEAVVINATKRFVGISAEYAWINRRYGPRGKAWTLKQQSIHTREQGAFDKLLICLQDGSETTVYFEISSFVREGF